MLVVCLWGLSIGHPREERREEGRKVGVVGARMEGGRRLEVRGARIVGEKNDCRGCPHPTLPWDPRTSDTDQEGGG